MSDETQSVTVRLNRDWVHHRKDAARTSRSYRAGEEAVLPTEIALDLVARGVAERLLELPDGDGSRIEGNRFSRPLKAFADKTAAKETDVKTAPGGEDGAGA